MQTCRTDIQTRSGVGVRRGWDKREIGIGIYTLPCVNAKLVGSCWKRRELSSALCGDLDGWDGGAERRCREPSAG